MLWLDRCSRFCSLHLLPPSYWSDLRHYHPNSASHWLQPPAHSLIGASQSCELTIGKSESSLEVLLLPVVTLVAEVEAADLIIFNRKLSQLNSCRLGRPPLLLLRPARLADNQSPALQGK